MIYLFLDAKNHILDTGIFTADIEARRKAKTVERCYLVKTDDNRVVWRPPLTGKELARKLKG
jgi:hypothetical protein